ncbi:MAG: hypothetical protein JNK78_07420 [Planctomycetes bacterium]|nr:hypothetical protein [Planctomycetota bacterium]
MRCLRSVAATLPLIFTSLALAQNEPDADGDGLSDFAEMHKHLTDPAKADTDGDGVPDCDWRERREDDYRFVLRNEKKDAAWGDATIPVPRRPAK